MGYMAYIQQGVYRGKYSTQVHIKIMPKYSPVTCFHLRFWNVYVLAPV